jgi:hypothetical protein
LLSFALSFAFWSLFCSFLIFSLNYSKFKLKTKARGPKGRDSQQKQELNLKKVHPLARSPKGKGRQKCKGKSNVKHEK